MSTLPELEIYAKGLEEDGKRNLQIQATTLYVVVAQLFAKTPLSLKDIINTLIDINYPDLEKTQVKSLESDAVKLQSALNSIIDIKKDKNTNG